MKNNHKPLLTIGIPAYNRPLPLIRLLSSIADECEPFIEVVICEDKSPSQTKIRKQVEEFRKTSKLTINYFENEYNLGYDKNLKEVINKSNGEYIMFMGDDDTFEVDNLIKYIKFLQHNNNLGYILRRSKTIHLNKDIEDFKYYPKTTFFSKGQEAYYNLFRKSVFVSGFCFKKEYASDLLINNFDSTLLYQLYLVAELTLNYPSAYCDINISILNTNQRGIPEFGTSENESKLYTPGSITIDNSINFMNGYFIITRFIDKKYNINSTEYFRKEFSKYSYPILSIQRNKGIIIFLHYCKRLISEVKIGNTIFFYIYTISLIVFGESICNKLVLNLKKIIGYTPTL
jgi:abequosyltransferase